MHSGRPIKARRAKQAAAEALALARRCGDLFGQGSALNSLALCEADLAQGLRLFGQSLDAYRAAGYVLSQASANGQPRRRPMATSDSTGMRAA